METVETHLKFIIPVTIYDTQATHCIIIINVAIQVSITNHVVDSSTLINIFCQCSSIPSRLGAKHSSRHVNVLKIAPKK